MLTILQGDCREVLKTLPDQSVQCAITSPPYFLQRVYLPDGHPDKSAEIGLEQKPAEYVASLVEVFREVWRVLKRDGLLWVVIGDGYVTNPGNGRGGEMDTLQYRGGKPHRSGSNKLGCGLRRKSLIGIPWRLAFALQDEGWIIRSEIIWSKKSPVPEGVTDRCTKSHETVFMLAKQGDYYFDQDAIKEKRVCFGPNDDQPSEYAQGNGFFDRGGQMSVQEQCPVTRNKRSVWTLGPEPFFGNHHAAFPTALVKPMVLSSSRVGDLVLDPFAGSGTTLQVALELGRRAIGIELSAESVRVAQQRCNVTPAML